MAKRTFSAAAQRAAEKQTTAKTAAAPQKQPKKTAQSVPLYEELASGTGDLSPVILTDSKDAGLLLGRIAGSVFHVFAVDVRRAKAAAQELQGRYPEVELFAAFSPDNAQRVNEIIPLGGHAIAPHSGVSWSVYRDENGLDATAAEFWQSVELARLWARVQDRINAPRKIELVNSACVLETEYPQTLWAVDNFIPCGLTWLSARPKKGKSWLALQIACAVAAGVPFMEMKTTRGPVIYAALEDTYARLQKRLTNLGWRDAPKEAQERLILTTAFPSLALPGLYELARAIVKIKPSLVIFDVWRACAPELTSGRGHSQEIDYKKVFPIESLALVTNTPIMILTHQNKKAGQTTETQDTQADSLGALGSAEGAITLNRIGQSETAKLIREGREYENAEDIQIVWQKGGGWRKVSEKEALDREAAQESERKRLIRRALEDSPVPLGRGEIAAITGLKPVDVSTNLNRMKQTKTVIPTSGNKYILNPILRENNNNNNKFSDMPDMSDMSDMPDMLDIFGESSPEISDISKGDISVICDANTAAASTDRGTYQNITHIVPCAESENTPDNLKQTQMIASIAPFFKGKSAEKMSEIFTASLLEYQRSMLEMTDITQRAMEFENEFEKDDDKHKQEGTQ